jgi:AcrR family transcriptional regulator
MPKEVDHDERRDEILGAVAGVLADAGLRGLTIRSLAARLGGSPSMVTHYYRTRHSLLADIGPWILNKWQAEIESLLGVEQDPAVQLRSVLAWLLPLTPESLVEEKAGLSLLAGTESDTAAVLGLREELDSWVRDLVRSHLVAVVDDAVVEPSLDLLYAGTRGITVCACEAPDAWPPERQMAVLDDLLDVLGLLHDGGGSAGRLRGMKSKVHRGNRKEEA